MTALAAAALMVLAVASAYRAATARYPATWALGVAISGVAACNAYVLAGRGWPWG